MYTARGLFQRLIQPEHLEAALADLARGKRRRPDVAWLLFRRGEVVSRLAAELSAGIWRPQGFELLRILDPKRRVIARAPAEDRLVHSALCLAMGPALTRSCRPEAFACRPGFGTHRATIALQRHMRRRRLCLHLDIRAYFPSIDLEILRGLVARRIRDERFLGVLESGRGLLDEPALRAWLRLPEDDPPRGRGLPIGARTSQVLAAVVYLDELDHLLTRVWKVPGYVRYVDDLFLFGDRRADLRRWRAELGEWLWRERGLRLKHPDAPILACAGHVDGLGRRIAREGWEVLPKARRRFEARLRAAWTRGEGGKGLMSSIAASVAAGLG